MKELAVLILDADANRAREVAATVEAAGARAVCFDADGTPPDAKAWSLMLIGAPEPDLVTEELLHWVNAHRGRGPLAAYGDQRMAEIFCRSARVRIDAMLPWPFGRRDLDAWLGGAETRRSRHWPIGETRGMRRIHRLIEQVAAFDTSVLVTGESGTGKELVARAIHEASPRRDAPFVPINCGAIPAELLESELFGHEKGAFTGAISARQGRFEIAEGGTLFLDEIGDMSLPMQVKLLRVLQERSFERVGSNQTRRCDVRIIAATHRDLEGLVEEGGFREDLFYRLNVFPIEVPPLRERLDDLPLLIEEMVRRNEAEGRGRIHLDDSAMQALREYGWPGNVRELSNLIERMTILCENGVASADDLPARYRREPERAVLKPGVDPDALPENGIDLRAHLQSIEAELIRAALERSGGTVAEAARLLGLRRTTLIEKLRRNDSLAVGA